MNKKVLIGVLFVGTVFAWYTVIQDFIRFYNFEGTVFKVTDCIIPNPVTTPCFYGSWAFLIALIWAITIIRQKDPIVQKKNQVRLTWFLVAGTLFAWGNFLKGLIKFYANQGRPTVGCSGQLVSNPFTTPCFIGAVIFLCALVVALIISRKKKELPVS